MAITFFGSARSASDGVSNGVTSPKDIAPPASMVAGDLVVVYFFDKTNASTIAISADGGQTWTAETASSPTGSRTGRLFWCRFNGTWSANPSWSYSGGGTSAGVMLVFRPTSGSNTWAVDVAVSNTNWAVSPQTVTGITCAANSVAVIGVGSTDDNEWTLNGGSWVATAIEMDELTGTDCSAAATYQLMPSGGATGNVTATQTAVGPDNAVGSIISFVESAASGDATATPATVAAVAGVPAPTAQAAAIGTPGTVAAVSAVPAPTAQATAIATPSTVASLAAVPAPTILAGSPDAVATPATVAAIAAVPASTVQAAAQTAPSSVAAVAAVPAPTVQAAARPTPGTVAATGAVPAPAVLGTARATPGTVAVISAVPAPTVRGAAITTPSSVAAVGSVPAPSVLVGGNSTAAPNTVAVIAAVPASTIQAAARSSPATAAVVAGVGAPTVRAGAVISPTTVTVVTSVPTASFPGSIVVSITEGDPSPATLLEADGGSVGRDARAGVLVGVEGG